MGYPHFWGAPCSWGVPVPALPPALGCPCPWGGHPLLGCIHSQSAPILGVCPCSWGAPSPGVPPLVGCTAGLTPPPHPPIPQDCAQGTARCMAFRCPLHSFERAAVLTARGRLWNSTFLEVRGGWDPRDGDRDGTPGVGTGTGPLGRGGGSARPVPPPQEYLTVTSVELIVRASVSVTSSIKNLVLKDASTQVCVPPPPSPLPRPPHPAAP